MYTKDIVNLKTQKLIRKHTMDGCYWYFRDKRFMFYDARSSKHKEATKDDYQAFMFDDDWDVLTQYFKHQFEVVINPCCENAYKEKREIKSVLTWERLVDAVRNNNEGTLVAKTINIEITKEEFQNWD